MSGRSAYVRKKITETKSIEHLAAGRGRAKSTGSSRNSEHGDAGAREYLTPEIPGYSIVNGRLPPPYIEEPINLDARHDAMRRDAGTPHAHGPMQDFAYATARKPTIKPEDIIGIERSGLRSAFDKRSDDLRKGIFKAFTFGRKGKKDGERIYEDTRPDSSATVRSRNDQVLEFVETLPTSHPSSWDPDNLVPPAPNADLPAVPSPQLNLSIKRWLGAGRPVQRWNKLRKDPELWDPHGDVLIYLGHRGQTPKPNPSFRLSSHIIEATDSRLLIAMLREGSTEEDIIMVPPMFSENGRAGNLMYHGGQPTPPASETASMAGTEGQISYEMYFPSPPNLSQADALRHAITTRNVFALLYHASLVGISLYQALTDLLSRLQAVMPPKADNVGTILNHLSARGIDDVRNDPETAVSLLAWSETPRVRWEEGWQEAFFHCAGMYDRIEGCTDFKHLTPVTRALLERACLETQLRAQAAEERLAEFEYGDVWPSTDPVASSPARAASERLQKFLASHYSNAHDQWPPITSGVRTCDGEDLWLTRTMARKLQEDFGALYDFLVNRDIIWDESEMRSSRKWMMISESGNKAFEADSLGLPLTDMLIEWDNKMGFPHIPHPYPLVPESIGTSQPVANTGRENLRKNDKDKKANEDRLLERRVQLAYTEATNIYALGSDLVHSDLVDAFVKFEKSDLISSVNPSAARRGRWVLIYCILQTLASVSVDSPDVRYSTGVTYHLSPRLKGTKVPPWKGASAHITEASHELSYCWLAPRAWLSSPESTGDSDTSLGEATRTTPVMRMMHAQGNAFPTPPQTGSSQLSKHGWQTPGSRSMQSSAGPSMWGGSSTLSTASNDAASSIRTPPSLHASPAQAQRAVVRKASGYGLGVGLQHLGEETKGNWPSRTRSTRLTTLPKLGISPSVTGNGGFFDLDEGPERELRRRGSRPVLQTVIRDFDELDVIDDHEP